MKKGGIYTDQKCTICGSNMQDNHRDAVACREHPDQVAWRLMVRYGKLSKRYTYRDDPETNYQRAKLTLEGWRYKELEGSFDERDYKAGAPLGFSNLAEEYLKRKKTQVGTKHYRNIKNDLKKASGVWENTNIKEIRYAELEDFLHPSGPEDKLYGLSPKTRANIKSTLRDFWDWLVKREIIRHYEVPRFPEVSFHLSFRNTIDKETQEKILDEVSRLTKDFNIRIWIGIRFLATYVNVRPKELINIQESHIDLQQGRILIPHPKEGRPKYMYLIREDIDLLKVIPRGLPDLYFFRHLKGNGAAKPGQRFGHDYLWKWWKKACSNLGVEDVDLYGGTRHSTVIDLREQGHSPEAIKRASMHSTNKAFERYLQVTASEVRPIYADARRSKKKKCKQNEPDFVYTLEQKAQ